MIYVVPAAILVLSCLMGCGGPFQSGRYHVTSDARETTDDGIRIMLTGDAVETGGAERALLTIDVKPKIPRPYELACSSEHFGNWSKIHCKFRHVDQEVDLRFEWDRRTEKYTINDKSFDFVPGDEISVVLLEDGSVQ